jgi:transcription elongation factor SPT6
MSDHPIQRVDVAPYITPHKGTGDTCSVLAVSWGKGDPQRDAITVVFLDEAGRLREHTKIDNLVDTELRDEFVDILKRRKPDVIVIGGFSMATAKLSQRVKEVVHGGPITPATDNPNSGWQAEPTPINSQAFDIPVMYVADEVARIYQHSARAAEEFSALSPTAKYCVGLARYTQSPLNEYAALGADITAISFEEEDQLLVGHWMMLLAEAHFLFA